MRYIDIDSFANRSLVNEYAVSAIPRILIFDDMGSVIDTFFGLTEAAVLRAAIDKALARSAESLNATPIPS